MPVRLFEPLARNKILQQ